MDCAFSAGPDSTALIILALAAGCSVTAHHVDHLIRPESSGDAERAAQIADALEVRCVIHRTEVPPGPNLEARARDARFACLPPAVMTGHTADDQAETVLMRLIRGAGSQGLSAMAPDHRHPLLRLRRRDTEAICRAAGVQWVTDSSNSDTRFWRTRIRCEVLPLLAEVAQRDVVPLLARTADILREESAYLDGLAAELDPTDAKALSAAPVVIARRAVRLWLTHEGYPPDAATVERVLDVARGHAVACEVAGSPGGASGGTRRVERHRQRLHLTPTNG